MHGTETQSVNFFACRFQLLQIANLPITARKSIAHLDPRSLVQF
jgi:hypothetical protein